MDYLDSAASAIEDMKDDALSDANSVPSRVTEALGFKRAGQGIRETAFSKHSLARRNLTYAYEVGANYPPRD
jgi:hypothetical protein